MSETDSLEDVLDTAIESSFQILPMLMALPEMNDALQIRDMDEFLYGMVMGATIGVGGVFVSSTPEQSGDPVQDAEKMWDIISKRIPDIRKRIFGDDGKSKPN